MDMHTAFDNDEVNNLAEGNCNILFLAAKNQTLVGEIDSSRIDRH